MMEASAFSGTSRPPQTASSSSSLSERFRRAIQQNDLKAAQRIWERAQASAAQGKTHDLGPSSGTSFDIRNQTMLYVRHADHANGTLSSHDRHHVGHANGARQFPLMDALGQCLALSASQANVARHSRLRERNREAARAKSSLALAVENGASIELIQWLLEMGHERGDFSRDIRGCTAVSLAAQHNRTDVIEACCIDAVAHAATLHHQRSLMHGFSYHMFNPWAGREDEEEEEEQARLQEEESRAKADGDAYSVRRGSNADSTGEAQSPTMTLVTAAASTPSRRPSPNPVYLAKQLQQHHLMQQRRDYAKSASASSHQQHGKHAADADDSNRNAKSAAALEDDDHSSTGGSSEMDEIVGVTIQRLVDCPDELGRTGLALASMKGHEEAVKVLIDLGATLDLADYEGNRPLHYASAYNQLIIVQLLIERGCSYSLKNVLGFSAADYAWNQSLKSALEAFARAQFDSKRVRHRDRGAGVDAPAAAGTMSASGVNPSTSSTRDNARDANEVTAAIKLAGSTSANTSGLGLFPAPLRTPDHSLPASPQLKLSSHLRDIF